MLLRLGSLLDTLGSLEESVAKPALVEALLFAVELSVTLDDKSLAEVINGMFASELEDAAASLVDASEFKLVDNPASDSVEVASAAPEVVELLVALVRGGGSVTRRKLKQSPGICPTIATKTGWEAGSAVQM